ncbi:transcriptional repressor rco-1 [Thelonectria olida]|uniref:Transcriptional repressor rco-1 n=1 Tax=Thelonectria olida TaxID=1576542 RepID=A0A9P8VNR0_9HYPO|nr:transcriptional repressor rco-1 [Thelonectria olida]
MWLPTISNVARTSMPRMDTESGLKDVKCLKTFKGHGDFILLVPPTPDAKWLLSGLKDRGLQIWDVQTGTAQMLVSDHKNSVISVASSPRGGYFATGSGHMQARIWSYSLY